MVTEQTVGNVMMVDGCVWLQLGHIEKYRPKVWKGPTPPDATPETWPPEQIKDKRILVNLGDIISVGAGDGNNAAVLVSGGETIHVSTSITETMQLIEEATQAFMKSP